MTRTITLDDGTVLEGSCGASAGRLWVTVKNMTLPDAFAVFSDETKTAVIRWDYGSELYETYEGYTHLFCLQEDGENDVMVGLKEAVQNGN